MKDVLEEHNQSTDERGDTRAGERDREQEDDTGGRQVEEDEGEHELPEDRNLRDETNPAVDDATKDKRRHDAEGQDVEQDLGGEVREGRIVAVCTMVWGVSKGR